MSEDDNFTIFQNEPDGGNKRFYMKLKFKLIMLKLRILNKL